MRKEVTLTADNVDGLALYLHGEVHADAGVRYLMLESDDGAVRVDLGETVVIGDNDAVSFL